jgi:hypothetical protein
MFCNNLRFRVAFRFSLALAACLVAAAAPAASTIINPAAGYQAADCHTDLAVQSHDAHGNLLAIYNSAAGLKLFDRTTGAELYSLGKSGVSGDTWNSFVRFAPDGNSLWVGYDYNIYQVTNIFGTPSWEKRAVVYWNFDLAFQGQTPYVVGYGSAATNSLWRLDAEGPTAVAELGGFSAGLAFDSNGYCYYATNLDDNNRLVRFSPGQLAAGGLVLDNADTLATLPFPAYDTKVDAAGHVIFDFNDGGYVGWEWIQNASYLAVWNGTEGTGENYDLLGTAEKNHWFSYLGVTGDLLGGAGAIYLNDGAYNPPRPGLAEVKPVPEPAAIILLLAAAACRLLRRRK